MDKHKPLKNENSQIELRELAPEEFWGGRVSLEEVDREAIAKAIKEAADELDFTYSGFLVDGSYTFTRYPRRAFGPVPPIELYQRALAKLQEKLGGVPVEEEKVGEQEKFRVLLGLQEGYDEYERQNFLKELESGAFTNLAEAKSQLLERIPSLKERESELAQIGDIDELVAYLKGISLAREHSVDEVREFLGDGFEVKEAYIYSVGPWGEYQEPAVVITGDPAQLAKVYALADAFKQERIAVEDLGEGKAWMVETPHCRQHDEE